MSLAKSSAVLQSVTATALMFFACSCVNEEYDLSNGIDGTVDIQGSISLPIGSTEFMPIGDFLELDQDGQESILVADPQTGDYRLYIESDNTIAPEEPIEIQQITIEGEMMVPDGGVTYEEIGLGSRVENIISALDPGMDIPEDVRNGLNSLIDGMEPLEAQTTPIEINEDIAQVTDIVKDIKKIELEAPIALTLSLKGDNLTKGKVSLSGPGNEAFTITFPEFVTLEPGTDNLTIIDGHILSFDNLDIDIDDPESSTFEFSLTGIDLSLLDEGQGMVGDRLTVNDEISISELKLGLDINDFARTVGEIPYEIAIDLSLNVGDVFVKSVEAVLDPDFSIDPQSIDIGELPEFISGDNVTLDLYNPVIRLDVNAEDNVRTATGKEFPNFYMSADIDAFDKNGSSTLGSDGPIVIGDDGSGKDNSPVVIKEGMNHIVISRQEAENAGNGPVPADENYQYITVPELGKLISVIPDHITISDIKVRIPHEGSEGNWAESDYTAITFPQEGPLTYDVGVDYSIEVPLAFGKDLYISYSTDFNGWNENFSSTSESDYKLDLKEASIKFDFINSIPLELGLSAEAIDTDGNVMSDIDVELEGTLAAGNINNETSAAVVVKIVATQEALDRFDGLRLNIEATSGDMEGVALNKDQGVRLENISANIQGGIQLDLTGNQNKNE